MLHLRRLVVEGFGPFADKGRVEFPDGPGVTVVYGDNMRGKTSLLNAIRYAFFGKVLGRGSKERRLHTVTNRALAAEGKYGFSVSLTFDQDETEYELVRHCRPKVLLPAKDEDYIEDVMLRRGRNLLGPDEQKAALPKIFPHEVSRFFLFDGELLQEYEELLFSESEPAHKISEAIERILGMPILKRGRAHLTQLLEGADRLAAKEASKSQKTKALGVSLQMAAEQKEAHQREIREMQAELAEFAQQKAELEEILKSKEKYASLLAERDKLESELEEAVRQEKARKADLQRAMGDAWRTLLYETVRSARSAAELEAEKDWDRVAGVLRAQAAASAHCGVCDQDVVGSALTKLRESAGHVDGKASLGASAAHSTLADLRKFHESDNSGQVTEMWSQAEALRLRQAAHRDRLTDLKGALSDSEEDTTRRAKAGYVEVLEKQGVKKAAVDAALAEGEEIEKNIQRMRKELDAHGNAEQKAWQLRATLLGQAVEVFAAAVERYKADLRERVETSASRLFLAMTTERRDFARLAINEGYGLNIVHHDGKIEASRSAGAEHVVALALMGALQQNAPLRGPIMMDSLFGRLDGGHTNNVIKTLPEMAEQVVLLVHEAEVGRAQIRKLLGSSLVKEYELERVSARRTRIAVVK
jgi:DNA sulfur modification protein DndD